MPMVTAQSVAQTMMDRHGWFVVWSPDEWPMGSIPRKWVGGHAPGRSRGRIPAGSYVIRGVATQDDFDEQRALIGLPPHIPSCGFLYRAVAE